MSNNQDYDRPIDEIKLDQTSTQSSAGEISDNPSPQAQNVVIEPEIVNETDQSESTWPSDVKTWFVALPDVGKIAVGAVAMIISFSVLNAVLKLVTSLLTVGILAVILYGLYKLWVAPRT